MSAPIVNRETSAMDRVAPRTASAMAEHWNARAWRFDGAASHRRDAATWRAVLQAALPDPPRDVVDLGCGTGACALLAASLGYRATGVDGSGEMLAHARAAAIRDDHQIAFIHATMDEAGLPAASTDIVTLRNVLWTLETPAAALALARRILRPGGTILLSDGLWYLHRINDSCDQFGAHLPTCAVHRAVR